MLCFAALLIRGHAAPGDVDLSFNPGSGVGTRNDIVRALVVQPDGKLIAGGYFNTVEGLQRIKLARLNPDGSGDVSFNAGVIAPESPEYSSVYSLAL